MGEGVGRKMERKIIIVGDEECAPCRVIANKLKKEIAEGKVELKNVNDPEILEKIKDKTLKMPFGVIKEDNELKKCEIYAQGNTVLLECNGEIIPIKEED